MISRFQAEIATALATLAFGLVIVNGAREFGIGWDSSGPQPGAFPFYCGLLIALASAGTIATTIGRRMGGSAALADIVLDREQGKRVLAFFESAEQYYTAPETINYDKYYLIRINKNHATHIQKDTIMHEWAHCLVDWEKGQDHSDKWALCYARIYRDIMEETE